MKSIRLFLVLVVVAMVTLANFAAAVRGYLKSMEEAQRLFDQRMYQHIDLLNYVLPQAPKRSAAQVLELPSSIDRGNGVPGVQSLEFQWIDNQGRMLARSAGMPTSQVAPLEEGSRFVNFHHYRWHLLVARSADQQSWYLLAERDDQRYRMAEAIILQAVLPMLVALPLVALMIWWVIGVGLRPLRSLAAQLREREATDLRPLVLADMPQELLPLAHSANELLRRLESSFDREKRFSADAAHELRTPIAILRIHCDNLLKELQPTPASLQKLQVGIERMSYLVEQILLLNRTAPDHFMGQFAPVNLTALVKQAVVHASHGLAEKNLELEVQGDDCWIRGDAAALDSLVGNLLANAIKYTPAGGQLLLGCWRRGEQVVLEVMDSGPGIPESEYARVFDRFYRVAGDRHTSQVPGCGLGLAIVKQVVDLHQAHIQLSPGRGGRGLLVMVTFQALDRPAPPNNLPPPPSPPSTPSRS